MRINNKQLSSTNYLTLTLRSGDEEFVLAVSAPSNNFWERYRDQVGVLKPPKEPPLEAVRRPSGKVVKDENGQVKMERKHDPEYEAAAKKHADRFYALRIADVLRNADVKFDSQPPEGTDLEAWQAYADALYAEISHPETGFSAKERNQILDLSEKLESRIDVEQGLESFLSRQSRED